jgi:hypothetical protein
VSATILRWAGTAAAGAGRIGRVYRWCPILDANLVAPWDVQVVLLEEPRASAKLQRRQRHVGRAGRQFQRSIARGAQAELIKVMPSQPIATWITPCNSRSVKDVGTSTRRHIIGLIPVSHTLICRSASAFATGRSMFSLGTASVAASSRQITISLLARPRAPASFLAGRDELLSQEAIDDLESAAEILGEMVQGADLACSRTTRPTGALRMLSSVTGRASRPRGDRSPGRK